MNRVYSLLLGALLFFVFFPLETRAQETQAVSHEYLEKATVIEAGPSTTQVIEGTSGKSQKQSVTITVLGGRDEGTTTTFENDFTHQVKKGDTIYIRHTVGGFEPEMWSVSDPYRINVLIGIGLLFLVLLIVFGGIQGFRGLVSLCGSIVLIFYLLLPGIYSGYSPILISIGVSSLIIIAGSYITHGFNRTTTTAMLGMVGTLLGTGILTYVVIHAAQLSGFSSENNVYLYFNTDGRIDMVGLLFGGIIIGFLGVLYDLAIGQAIAIEELIVAGAHYTKQQVYTRALRIGREHIGALVNTLAIAYVGAALPLLLLFKQGDASILYIINSELFATEIIRIIMGSIGLILSVPITTLIATNLLYGKIDASTPRKEHHHHSH